MLLQPSARPDTQALRDVAPMVGSVLPFGLIVGLSVGGLAIEPAAALAATFMIYGGSAQLTATTLLHAGAGAAAVLAAVAVVQARLALYGAGLEPFFRGQSHLFRWLGPIMIVDQTFAMVTARPDELRDPARFRRYWLSACGALTVGWLAAVGAGIAFGPVLPAESPLGIAVPAIFVALLAPRLRSVPAVAAGLGGGGIAALAATLPHGAGLLLGALGGVAIGAGAARLRRLAPARQGALS
jgi:predicted branched-subunit amino acid permease